MSESKSPASRTVALAAKRSTKGGWVLVLPASTAVGVSCKLPRKLVHSSGDDVHEATADSATATGDSQSEPGQSFPADCSP